MESMEDDLARLQRALDQLVADSSEGPSCSSSSGAFDVGVRVVRVACASAAQLPFTVRGGAAQASLVHIDTVQDDQLLTLLLPGDVLLCVEDKPVSGMTVTEVNELLSAAVSSRESMAVEVTSQGSLPNDLCEILAEKRYPQLQTTIRDNVYRKTVPYTTRPPRPGEVDGEHYLFVSVEQFDLLVADGRLLEHGAYEGHLYGTPRPCESATSSHSIDDSSSSSATMVEGRLGALPPNWEIAYAENGEKYFIDHNSGSTQWNDPRELPPGWEQVDDPVYGTFYVDHVNRSTTYDRPLYSAVRVEEKKERGRDESDGVGKFAMYSRPPPVNGGGGGHFTRNADELKGELISCRMIKGPKGLGFTLIGNDSNSNGDEFIQVKAVLPHGAAAADGVVQPGDVIVSVNGHNLLGASQEDACRIFVACPVGDPVDIVVCRGYPLFIHPNNKIITESVYSSGWSGGGRMRGKDLVEIDICKGPDGFGFTIADSVTGQRVKKVLYPSQCAHLQEGDTIVELDGRDVRSIAHQQLVDMLRDRAQGSRGRLLVRRSSPKQSRSRTPTAAFRYGESRATPAPSMAPRSKTPAPQSNGRSHSESMYTRNNTLTRTGVGSSRAGAGEGLPPVPPSTARIRPSSTTLGFATTPNYMPVSAFRPLNDNNALDYLLTVNLIRKPQGFGFRLLGGTETGTHLTVGQIVAGGAASEDGRLREGDEIVEIDGRRVEDASHAEAVSLLEQAAHVKYVKLVVRRRTEDGGGRQVSSSSPNHLLAHSVHLDASSSHNLSTSTAIIGTNERDVILHRESGEGFGFIIISPNTRDGASIGQVVSGSPAARSGELRVGDRVVAVNGTSIAQLPHREIVQLIKASGLTVRLTIADPPEPMTNFTSTFHYPVPAVSSQNGGAEVMQLKFARGAKGFGFSIRGGQEFDSMPLFVLRIAEDGPAHRDGRLRVGDQLVSINGRDTRGLTHEEAISLIKLYPSVELTISRHSPQAAHQLHYS